LSFLLNVHVRERTRPGLGISSANTQDTILVIYPSDEVQEMAQEIASEHPAVQFPVEA
jgi:hypothetical protein